jgi:hypothetical protein
MFGLEYADSFGDTSDTNLGNQSQVSESIKTILPSKLPSTRESPGIGMTPLRAPNCTDCFMRQSHNGDVFNGSDRMNLLGRSKSPLYLFNEDSNLLPL